MSRYRFQAYMYEIPHVWWFILPIHILLVIWCLYGLYRAPRGLGKWFWALVVILLPVLGPIFYKAFSSPPPVKPDDQRSVNTIGSDLGGFFRTKD